MELTAIEIVGFKSFPDKIRVEFGKGVTAIVGPNGSGKSNIADAVRWVLGEQSAKTLRGSRMEDVIFAGTERRKPLGFAQVTLFLGNEDRALPIDYDQVVIRRRLYRSGESEYMINGARCRLKDVQELLMDTGIGKDGYSMIGQGQIDQLLSSKPQDRRLIFEEAAGITKYKTRREEAEKKLEDEKTQLTRVSDILTELTLHLEPLKAQVETAEKYLALKEDLKFYEVTAFIGEYDQMKAQYDTACRNLGDLNDQIKASVQQRKMAKEKSEQLEESAKEARLQLSKMNGDLSGARIALEKADGDLRLAEQSKTHQEAQQQGHNQRLAELEEQISDRLATVEKEQKQLQDLDRQIKDAEEERQKAADQLTVLEEERRQAGQDLAVKSQQVQTVSEGLTKASIEAEKCQQQVSLDSQEAQHYLEDKSNLEVQQAQEQGKADQAAEQLQQQTAAYQEQDAAYAKIKEETVRLEKEEGLARRRQESLLLQMKDAVKRIQWMQGMEDDYEGFSAPVRLVMKLKENPSLGIIGTVSDILTVKKEYTTALETALGMAVQNIVVEDTASAKQLIGYLREKRGGRATFLPLDSVMGRKPAASRQAVLAMPGVIGFGDDLADYQPRFRAIAERLLGNVVVVSSFDEGAAVSKKFGAYLRVVTLKGDIFNIGGSITGGSSRSQSNGILTRHQQLEEMKENLKALRLDGDAAASKLSAITKQKTDLTAEGNRQEQELIRLRKTVDQERQQLQQAQFSLSAVTQQLQNMVKDHDQSSDVHSLHKQKAQQSLKEKEQWEQKLEVAKKEEEEVSQKASDLAAAVDRGKETVSAAAVKLSGCKQQKQFAQQALSWEEAELKKLRDQQDQALQQKEEGQRQIDQALQKMEEIRQLQQQLSRQIDQAEEAVQKQEALAAQTDKERADSQKEADEILTAYAALEKEQVRLENQTGRAKQGLDELTERMWEDYQITYQTAKDLAEGRSHSDMASDQRLTDASALSKTKRKQQINLLKKQIRDLGPVNVNAIDEYKSMSERKEFLTRQHEDILKSEENLTEIIRQMTVKMEQQFKEQFAAIAKTFDRVFGQIFGGGHGILRMTEGQDSLEAGIEIIGQPPGKKVQNMAALSGGERALTAIALLFAIQQQHPAPFCILDEIEAALDDVNVERFANYLKNMKDTQFIVITHRKGTMMVADTMYGVTMEEKGVSKCISVRFTG